MSDNSAIEWTDATWPVVAGCTRVSAGCDRCYAIGHSHRLAGNPNSKISGVYAGTTTRRKDRLDWTAAVRCLPERLQWPFRWRKPRRIFVANMADLFHHSVPDEFIDQVFAVMANARQHTFQVLTKRPDRMREYLSDPWRLESIYGVWSTVSGSPREADDWPLPNVWIGTSVEDQATADGRIPHLLNTPAAVRFISAEPLLGPLRITHYLADHTWGRGSPGGLNWIVCGSESGHGARPAEPDWFRRIRDQVLSVDVPRPALFVKQFATPSGHKIPLPELDGRQWREWPA